MGNSVVRAEAPPAAAGAKKTAAPKVGKSGKKICCSCPDTRKLRDACTVENGPDAAICRAAIEAHKVCLREEGFRV